ncbi:MAG: radical SAM protein [Planctomycetota bacterium]|nr:radical SAM protein [Planctomycetota bacterium]
MKSRKIRFVEPGSQPGRPFNAWIRRWPLLGPITLATILDEQGYDVAVYNENISGPLETNARGLADVLSADVVGITTMTATANRAYELARLTRAEAPNATIVFGGSHATFMPEEAQRYGDLVVCGEAENIIGEIASGAVNSGIIHPDPPADLNTLPTLKHELMIDFDRLIGTAGKRGLYELPVMTSRGCPHGCTYCSVTRMFGRRVRRQSPEKVEADLWRYKRRGFRHVFFYDDNLTADRTWTKDLLRRMEPMHIRWNAQVRADMHWYGSRSRRDDELLSAMRRSGGNVLYIGYETIDEATAKQWRKGYSGYNSLSHRLHEDTRTLHKCGFWIHGMFILGPEHGKTNINQIVKFASRAGIESIQLSILTPLPGTPLFEQMRDKLIFTDFPADWNYYDGTHCVYPHNVMGIEGLQRTILRAHLRFYHSIYPGLRRLRNLLMEKKGPVDKIRQLWRHALMARTILKQWKKETVLFLEHVREKGEIYLLPL